MVTIRKNTVGGDGTFSFSSSAPAVLPGSSLTTTNGTASNVFNNVTPGTYTVTETVASGWTLSSIQCGGNATVDLAQKSATFTVAAGGDVVCLFTNTEVRNRTSSIIRNFMMRRGDLITSDTGRPRLVERLQPSSQGASLPYWHSLNRL
jgi:hypothetical protein